MAEKKSNMPTKRHKTSGELDTIEADRLRDEIALRMLTTPPKRHDEMKIGKRASKRTTKTRAASAKR
jgi:hypothetical protein